MDAILIVAAVTALIGLVFAYGLFSWVRRSDAGPDGMTELAGFIRESAVAFLKREHMVMIPVILILSVIIGLAIGWKTAALYAMGALSAALTGVFGILASAGGSSRIACSAMNSGINAALKTALRSGSVTGLCGAGLGLLGAAVVLAVSDVGPAKDLAGFGLGVATAALFGSSAGGIFHRAAKVGADNVKKSKAKLTEGDPRNPAAMAGYAGDYAGNAVGLGMDLFLSYVGSIVAAVIVAVSAKSINPEFGYPFDLPALQGTAFPLLVLAGGIIGTVAGIMLAGGKLNAEPAQAINAGKCLCAGITAVISIVLSWVYFANFNCAVCILIGMLIGALYGKIARTYHSGTSRRLKKMAERSRNGYLTVGEYGVGMLSTLWPLAFLAAGLLAANAFADYYGIALAAVGLLSSAGITASVGSFASVSATAGEIARMARLSEDAREAVDKLDLAGKNGAATGRGFAASAAALTAAALFFAYADISGLKAVDLLKPAVLAGLFAGAVLPVFLPAMTMHSAGKAAIQIIEDAKRQFDSDPGIMKGASRPDYAKCADAGTKAAIKGIIVPGLFAFLTPLAFGFLFGTEALGGLLSGSLCSGALTAALLANAGGAWRHSEKQTPGDPFKDAAGSSVCVMILLSAFVAVLFAPVFISAGGL